MKRKKRNGKIKTKRNGEKSTNDLHEVVLAGGELAGAGRVADLGGTRAPRHLLLQTVHGVLHGPGQHGA